MARRYEALDRSIRNAIRVTGLVFLPALVALNVGLLLDEDRRTQPTDGRFIYALGLPGWIVDGFVALLFTAGTIGIVVSWVLERRRDRQRAEEPPDDGRRARG